MRDATLRQAVDGSKVRAEHVGQTTAPPDEPPEARPLGDGFTPDDIPALFSDRRLSKDGSDGSISPLAEILRDMETRFPPEIVWGMMDGMLRDSAHADDADRLANLFAGNEDAPSFGVRYDILYRLCADDGIDVAVRSDALPYLSSLAFGKFVDKDPCQSLYHIVEDPAMREELSQAAIMADLAGSRLPHFRPLLRGICLMSRGTDYDKLLSSALALVKIHGKDTVLASVRFMAGHECMPEANRHTAERLMYDVENT